MISGGGGIGLIKSFEDLNKRVLGWKLVSRFLSVCWDVRS